MLKAIFFDMDETLCATSRANELALKVLSQSVVAHFPSIDGEQFCARYLEGIYKQLNEEYPQLQALLGNELSFRVTLIQLIGLESGVDILQSQAQELQDAFDQARMENFDFFEGIKEKLIELKQRYTLVLITNGPVFSQHPKLDAVAMHQWMDHIIVGGEEPAEKPAEAIFAKALRLANVRPEEAIHIGDSFECDIKGAFDVQIPSIWVTSMPDHVELNGGVPVYKVSKPIDAFDVIEHHASQNN